MDRGTKSYINDLGHMTKMAATPIHVYEKKSYRNLLLWDRLADSLEPWYVASGLEVYKVYITDDPGLSLT